MARLVFEAMGDKQAQDLVILDLRPVSLVADFFVIGTVESPRQFKAVVQSAIDALRGEEGTKPGRIEGEPESGWMVLDLGDVVVHVFDEVRREYYSLESLWEEAPLVVRMR